MEISQAGTHAVENQPPPLVPYNVFEADVPLREAIEREGGLWEKHEPWGRRRLAYEIDHKGEGAYHLLTFASTPATLDEISRVLKITDGVMRHLGVRRVAGASARPGEARAERPVARAAAARQDSGTQPTA
jgi:ribosomal protein S6